MHIVLPSVVNFLYYKRESEEDSQLRENHMLEDYIKFASVSGVQILISVYYRAIRVYMWGRMKILSFSHIERQNKKLSN